MASNYNINANIQFKLNSASTQPVINSLTKQFAGKKINIPVNLQFKNVNLSQINQQNVAFRNLTKNIAALGISSSKSALALRNLYGVLRQVNNSVHSFGQASHNLQSYKQQVNSTAKAVGNLGTAFQQANHNTISFSESIGISARRFISFGVAAAVLSKISYDFRGAAVAALEFDKEMIRFKQVGSDSNEIISDMAKTISKLGINWGISSAEMAKSAVVLRQAGLSARETKVALEALGKTTLSSSFEDLKSSTEGVIAILKQFGGSAQDLEKQLSAVSKVSADFPVESADLVEAIKRTGGAFKQAGGNLNELLALFTTIRGTTRESAESIATGMRTILARLQDPAISKKLHEIGVEIYDWKGQFVGPLEAINRLGEALRKLPAGDIRASQILKDIGGLRQLSRVLPLIYNNDTTEAALRSARNSMGKLEEDARTSQEAILNQLARIKEGFLDLFRTIATDSSVRTVLNGIITGIEGVTEALRTLKPLIPALLAVTAVKSIQYSAQAFQSFRRGFTTPVKGYAQGGVVNNGGLKVPGFATGGTVAYSLSSLKKLFKGAAKGTDTIPAMLSPGEFVVNKEAAQSFGYGRLAAINSRAYRMQRRREKYNTVSPYEEGETLAQHLELAQLNHRKRLHRTMGDYRVGTGYGYEKGRIINHKQYLSRLINEKRLSELGYSANERTVGLAKTIFKIHRMYEPKQAQELANRVIYPERGKISLDKIFGGGYEGLLPKYQKNNIESLSRGGVAETVAYYAHGGLVGKDLNMDILQDFLDKAGIKIKASDHLKDIYYDPNLKSNGAYYLNSRKVAISDKAKISTLLHELGHAIDHRGGSDFGSNDIKSLHHQIAKSYVNLPGVNQTSIYGNGGLNVYPSNQHHSEGFANAFAAFALNKGLTKEEKEKHFSHFNQQLSNPDIGNLFKLVGSNFGGKTPKTSATPSPIPFSFPVTQTPPAPTHVNIQPRPNIKTYPAGKGKVGNIPIGGVNINPPKGGKGYGFTPKATPAPYLPIPATTANPAALFSPSSYNLKIKPIARPNNKILPQPGAKPLRIKNRFIPPLLPVIQPGMVPSNYQIPSGYAQANYQRRKANQATNLAAANAHFQGMIGPGGYLSNQQHNIYGPKNLYHYTSKDVNGKDKGLLSIKATSEDAARQLLAKQGKFITSIKRVDNTFSNKVFPTLSKFLSNTTKGANGVVRKGGLLNKLKGVGATGLLAASVAVPMISDHIFGNTKEPGAAGKGGVVFGQALSGGVAGASIGSVFGPVGTGLGALAGAAIGAAGALKEFSEDAKEANFKDLVEDLKSVVVNSQTGKFQYNTGGRFGTALSKGIKAGVDSQDTYTNRAYKELSLQGVASAISTPGLTVKRLLSESYTPERGKYKDLEAIPAQEREALSQSMKEIVLSISKQNPNQDYKQIIDKLGNFQVGKNQYNAGEVLGLNIKNVEEVQQFINSQKKAKDLQDKMNAVMRQVNQQFELTAQELESFGKALQTSGEQYGIRQQYSDLSSAPLKGQLAATPNNITLGNFGKPGTIAGDLNDFSKQGGGYDQARQALLGIVQNLGKENIANINRAEIEAGVNTQYGARAETAFRNSGAGGHYNEQIAANANAVLMNSPNLHETLQNEGAGAIVDKILGRFKGIKDAGQSGNDEVRKTYAADQQRQIENLNHQFEIRQQRSQLQLSVGEAANNNLARFNAVNPDLVSRGNGRFISEGERTADLNLRNQDRSFYRSQIPFGAAGLNAGQIENKYNNADNRLSSLKSSREKATSSLSTEEQNKISSLQKDIMVASTKQGLYNQVGDRQNAQKQGNLVNQKQKEIDKIYSDKNISVVRDLDREILKTQDSMRNYATALKNLADNTTILEAAQKKYETAVAQFTADYESRKKDADVYAFGSGREKMQLAQRENITQQALGMNQEEFSSLPDQIKKIVYERLQETQGMTRSIQQYDKYGRERGTVDVTGEQALNYFRQPALDNLTKGTYNAFTGKRGLHDFSREKTGKTPTERLRDRAIQAGQDVGMIESGKIGAQKALLNINERSANKQTVEAEGNYQKYLEGINESIEKQMAATQKFLEGSAELTKALNGFNGELKIERNGRIEVILNGGALLQAMKGDVEKEVMEQVIEKLKTEVAKAVANQPAR